MKTTLQLTGLDCAVCAAELEEIIQKTDGVQAATVSFVNQKLTVEYDNEQTLQAVIATANAFEDVQVLQPQSSARAQERETVLHIENLDCPVCAETLQAEIAKLNGVRFVSVDYLAQTITLQTDNEKAIKKAIDVANHFEEVHVLDGDRYALKRENHTKQWILIGVSALLLFVGVLLERLAFGTFSTVARCVAYAVAYILVAYPVLISTVKNISKGRVFDENFLMTVASIGAVALGEYSEAVLVMLLYQLGELLQAIAVGSSRASVAKLMELKSVQATKLVNGAQTVVLPEDLRVGDTVLVKAGEKVPTDGVLMSDEALLDTKSLTGEAALKRVSKGEEILSGCINAGGVYEMTVTRLYEDCTVSKILDMVENATSGKAEPEKFIAKFAKYYTPIVCILALLAAVCAPLISGLVADGYLHFKDLGRWVQSALTFLVISCPCALIISVPLTYFSGIGTCANNGILMKGATYLDVLAKATIFAFDKTGTLTEGNFAVCQVSPELGISEQELIALIAAVERGSAHPIAQAFAGYATPYQADSVTELAGRGLRAELGGENVLVGNAKLLQENGVIFTETSSAYTVVYAAKDGKYLGYVEVGDKLRENAKTALNALKELGITRTVMLTGDNEARAQKIANEIGMYELNAGLLPNEKLEKAKILKEQGALVYVGDGINDAPVMTAADCAVSMGKLGSAAAVEASDVVLLSDDLTAISKGVKIARKTRETVMQNIVFSIVMKTAFMALGALGVLPLSLAVFADVGVMLLAVLNSFRVRKI